MIRTARTPAAVAAYLVLVSTAALGAVLLDNGPRASAAGHDAADPDRIPAAAPAAPATAPAPPAPAPPKKTYPNNLQGWVSEARDTLKANGDRVPSAEAVTTRALTESSGNPHAENHWDGNQGLYGGTYGLLQTIKPTFDRWCLPGHEDILSPVDSIIAGVRYANDRYGSFEHVAYSKQGY